jgi:hypothetical protein
MGFLDSKSVMVGGNGSHSHHTDDASKSGF